MESLNHDSNWLKTIIIEIDKFLTNSEYINFFMKMYIQWIKDNGYTSSSRTLSILCPTRIEKLALSQFQLYIETGNCDKASFSIQVGHRMLNVREDEV